MSLKYYNAGSSIRTIPSESYRNDFNAIMDMGFTNAPNVFYDVEVEQTYGEKDFEVINTVRIDAVFEPTTGTNLGDDYKRLIFLPDFPDPFVGQMFKWKNSYWLVRNTDNYQSLAKSAVCQRCNNVLKWKDEYGKIIIEPCILPQILWEPSDYTTSQMVIAAGYTKVHCQRNARTNSIRENMRFLFGVSEQMKSFRVYGNGQKIYLNSETMNNNSPSISEFNMGASFINDMTDDLVNGIADAYQNEYSLVILDGNINQSVGFEKQLSYSVSRNGIVVPAEVIWSSSDESIVLCDNFGNITCNAVGLAKIKCEMKDNEAVYDEINVVVSDVISDNYEVVISPMVQTIYEDEEQTYNCILTNNDISTPDVFTFTASGVPQNYYRLTVLDGNNFKIMNIEKYLDGDLNIRCQSGEVYYDLKVSLRGWF